MALVRSLRARVVLWVSVALVVLFAATGVVLDVAFRELSAARDLSMVLCRKSAIEKVASFLCSLAERRRSLGPTGMMSLPMTRSDIADYLGLSIETVSRNITKLRVKRIISLPRAGLVLIHDMDRLKRIGDCETDRG